MGKLDSFLKINGKVGDRVYYTLNGKPVVRKAAAKRRGPKTKAEQDRALFSKEFGRASAAGKVLRQAFADELRELPHERYLYQRVNRLMLRLRNCDPAAPGERTVAGGLNTEEGRNAMADFSFHKKRTDFHPLLRAQCKGMEASIAFSATESTSAKLIEVQVNFDKCAFRKHYHPLPERSADQRGRFKKQFRSRKGYTNLIMIFGKDFLQGVVVTRSQ